MANQRIGLKCVCGAEVFLAKRYGEGFYTAGGPPEKTAERLDEFFDEHAWCNNTQDHFETTYEIERDYDSKRLPLDQPRLPNESEDQMSKPPCPHLFGEADQNGMMTCSSCGHQMSLYVACEEHDYVTSDYSGAVIEGEEGGWFRCRKCGLLAHASMLK